MPQYAADCPNCRVRYQHGEPPCYLHNWEKKEPEMDASEVLAGVDALLKSNTPKLAEPDRDSAPKCRERGSHEWVKDAAKGGNWVKCRWCDATGLTS